VAWQSFLYVQRIYALGAVSDIAHIPTWIPHSAIPLSFALIALIVVLRALQKILGPADAMPDAAS
jgi:TRAP-type C4-dicarboxylate transport system permease small subunit